MSAFLICDVVVKNTDKLKQYLKLSEPTLAPYGGVFHVQAGEIDTLEGDWNPGVIVIAQFPSMEQARLWYHSAEYAHALKVKSEAIDRNMILVSGLRHT